MKGSVRKITLPSGRVVWRLQVDAGRDQHGKRVRISRNFERKGEANDALVRILKERQDGLLVAPSAETFGAFLAEWLTEHADCNCARKTAERYRQLAQYAIDALGDVPLSNLSTRMLERLYRKLRDKPLSARTVKNVHVLLRNALNTALRWKLLRLNPAVPCQLPKVDPKKARVLEDAELDFLISAAAGHPWLYALLFLACATGMRRGELLALTWPDFDLVYNWVEVSKSLEQTKAGGLRIKLPKNDKTRRLTLPAAAVDVLKQHRRAQQANRDAFGGDYRTDLDLVFATPEGNYLRPDSVSPKVCGLAQRVGLKGISLHNLRHTHGSQLLAQGCPLATVSQRLGHSSVAVTAALYLHAFTADEMKAAEMWDAKIGANILRPSQTAQ